MDSPRKVWEVKDLSVRIYALAKELKVDSKVLVEACNKAGIEGKGSALASLTDEEAAAVRAYLSGGGKKSASSTAVAEPPTPQKPTQDPSRSAVRREDYIAPAGTTGRLKNLDTKPSRAAGEKKKAADTPPGKPTAKAGPQIKLAPMPTAAPPVTPPAAAEPAPQKPELRLPVDAIRAGKMGEKPLSEHLRKQESKRKERGPQKDRVTEEKLQPLSEFARREKLRKGRKGAPDADEKSKLGMGGRELRQLNRKRGAGPRRRGRDDDEGSLPRHAPRFRRTGANTAAPRKSKVVVQLPCTVREFSESVGLPARVILGKLLEMKMMMPITASLDLETAELLSMELGLDAVFKEAETLEDQLITAIEDQVDSEESLLPRPPVVTFLGHVDHGKTSLLDKIIGLDVVSGEHGGITQHIRAYQIEKDGRHIAFVDTPGHEAFTQMRARGAQVTDIVVLVVAADDGIMPQTEEAISHARAAGVPMVVALNKIDLPGVDPQKALQQLAAQELLPTEWGGDIEVIKTSAITGDGIDDLLETLLTIAELHELKANPDRPAYGTCLESELDEGSGVISKLLVQKGTLNVGDVVVCGTAFGKIKAMQDTLDLAQIVDTAEPSTPVNVLGMSEPPGAGEHFYVLEDISAAREIAARRRDQSRQDNLGGRSVHVTLETLHERLGAEGVRTLNVILRADVRGSIEAVQKELTKLEHPEVAVKVLQATVGGITEADVELAHASNAVILGFNVIPDEGARSLAEQRGVQVRRYNVIYKLTDDLRKALSGLLKPEEREMELGRALVQRLFSVGRVGVVAGCRVLAGNIERNARIRVSRDSRVIGDYPIESLRREKDDVKEVRDGLECGIKLANFNDLKEGDILEAYRVEEVAREL